MAKLFQGFIAGWITYMALQALVMPVSMSCQKAFTRQTLSNPAWAKEYWDDLANAVLEQHQLLESKTNEHQ